MFYIGKNDVAQKASAVYVGVNGVARKVSKAYVGVNGVARLCWSGDDPSIPTDPAGAAKLNESWKYGTQRSTITKITFTRTYTPTGSEDSSWTIATGDYGDIMGYRKNNEVTIVGDNRGQLIADDCHFLFNGCYDLIQIVGFELVDTSLVTDMRAMFANCGKLTSVNLTNLNTSNVTKMSNMFGFCESLTSLDVTNFDTSKVTDMSHMFSYCTHLASIDVSGFDTSKVTDMQSMFEMCMCLTSLDLTSFNTNKVSNMIQLFQNCVNLNQILVSANTWVTASNNSNMFYDCGCSDVTYV